MTEHDASIPDRRDRKPEVAARFASSRIVIATLAIVALAAALVGAIGPSQSIRTTFSWPPSALPERTPARAWYTPLLLIRQRPAKIRATIPCSRAPALPTARDPVTVLATARAPERSGGLAVLRDDKELLVKVGRVVLARIDLASDQTESSCRYALRIRERDWSISGGPIPIERSGRLAAAPFVSGLFSELDLRRSDHPSVDIVSVTYASRPTARQSVAWMLALLAAMAALRLVGIRCRPKPLVSRPRARPSTSRRFHPTDAVVGAYLIGWWVLSPAFVDDGWVAARERAYSLARGFTNYYDAFGTNLPSDYWLEWTQHWLLQTSNALVVQRIPALACLCAAWVLCRYSLERVLELDAEGRRSAMWAMAPAFLAGASAWGMTLRPEPVTALLVTGVLACCISFRRRPSGAALALSAILVPLALTAHYSGIVALAPLLAIAPDLRAWVRRNGVAAVAVAACAAALLLVLLSIGADIGQRLADAKTTNTYSTGNSDSWYQELARYERLGEFPFATPLRRGTVALMVLLALFFLFRRTRARSRIDLPARALIIAFPLLVLTSSKLPWHFGALIGVTAVVAGTEAVRLQQDGVQARRLFIRPFVFCIALFFAAGWAWSVRGAWNPIDLSTLGWRPDFETHLPLQLIAPLAPLVVLFALMFRALIKRRHDKFLAAPWITASWSAPMLVVPLIAFTGIVFIADAVKTDSWTLTRQNLGALRAEGGCGLADDVRVTEGRPPHTVTLTRLLSLGTPPTFVNPNRVPYFPCARLPRISTGVAEAPRFVVATWQLDALPVLYPTSPFYGLLDLYRRKRLRLEGPHAVREIAVYEFDPRIPGTVELPPEKRTVTG